MDPSVTGSRDDNWWTRFLQRHRHLELLLFLSILSAVILFVFWLSYGPPEFSATVTSFQGLQPASHGGAEGAPTFAVTLRARNRDVWRHCFKPGAGSAVVAYAGVPLARADLPGFCVPGLSAAKVRFIAAGGGLGVPDSLSRLEEQRGRRERVPLTVRVWLHEGQVVPHNAVSWSPLLLWCDAMLDGPERRAVTVTACERGSSRPCSIMTPIDSGERF
ncbi:hypothetical protein BS78_03G292000 [Paspalum vaginatum]|nr:hypothetical protein BS78_03G292000 [Paspalum vaginatum]